MCETQRYLLAQVWNLSKKETGSLESGIPWLMTWHSFFQFIIMATHLPTDVWHDRFSVESDFQPLMELVVQSAKYAEDKPAALLFILLFFFFGSSSARRHAIRFLVMHPKIKSKSNTISGLASWQFNLKTNSLCLSPEALNLKRSYAGAALASPSPYPLTGTIAAGSPQKTLFYNNTRPQSKTDNVNGFMVRYTVQLMFSREPAPLHCLSLALPRCLSAPLLSFILAGSPSLPVKNPLRHRFWQPVFGGCVKFK